LISEKTGTTSRSNRALVKSKDTLPEILVRKRLHQLGFRFRLHQRVGGTRPDIVLNRWNCCIFVHGCYWHRHKDCRLSYTPKSNTAFWQNKFHTNVMRDQRNLEELGSLGWKVGVIWECAIRDGLLQNTSFDQIRSDMPTWTLPK